MENGKKKGGSSRNSEKRKERSKVAARCRRGKESEIFSELLECLPLPEHVKNSLDKASIARLALTYLKLKKMMGDESLRFNEIKEVSPLSEIYDPFINNALSGFVLVISSEGDFTFVSESITVHLGLSQCEVMGHSMFDFIHPCDHVDVKELLTIYKNEKIDHSVSRSAFLRIKCTITSKGRNVHLRAATYKTINCSGHLFQSGDKKCSWFVGVGEPLPDPTNVIFPLNKQAFVTRHSPDMKCEDVAGSLNSFLGYDAEDLVGNSLFDFYHAEDSLNIGKSFKALFDKGQIQTERCRFLAKWGGYVWVVTQATVLKAENSSKPNGIICLHFITSGIEHSDLILSSMQRAKKCTDVYKEAICVQTELVSPLNSSSEEKENVLPNIFAEVGLPIRSNPTPSTAKIFAPRTDDMDNGFLMPCNNTFISSKEEPDDLTHLAPIAGDDCVELHVPLLDDLLKSFDQANMEMNGLFIDVDIEDFNGTSEQPLLIENDQIVGNSASKIVSPLFNAEPNMGISGSKIVSPLFNIDPNIGIISSQIVSPSPLFNIDPNIGISGSKIVSPLKSPLFNTDPHMGNSVCKIMSSLKSPLFNGDPHMGASASISPPILNVLNEEESLVCTSGDYLSEDPYNFYGMDEESIDEMSLKAIAELKYILEQENSVKEAVGDKSLSKTGEMDEMSEFTAPFIPVGESEDIALLYSDFKAISQLNDNVPPSSLDVKMKSLDKVGISPYPPVPLHQPSSTRYVKPMLRDENIDAINWTIDLEAIMSERKPGDGPKVVTSSIFGNPGSPPTKVRKLAIVPGTRRPGTSLTHPKLPSTISKCPFLKRYGISKDKESGNYATDQINKNNQGFSKPDYSSVRKRNLYGVLMETRSIDEMPSLSELTPQDFEGNVGNFEPNELLQGSDLLSALELDNSNDSIQNIIIP